MDDVFTNARQTGNARQCGWSRIALTGHRTAPGGCKRLPCPEKAVQHMVFGAGSKNAPLSPQQ